MKKKDIAIYFLNTVVAGQVDEAYNNYIDTGFVHHNAYFPGDREALLAAMKDSNAANPDRKLMIKHTIEDGDFVAIHSHMTLKPADTGLAAVHLFRFKDDKIAELWDLAQPVQKESPNQNGMF